MAKRIVLVLVLVAGALFAYNYMTTGKLTLIPSATLSDEERELDGLEAQIKQSLREFAGAGRAAGLSGVDTTSDAESARVQVQKVERRLDEMGRKVSASAKEKYAKVKRELEEAKRELGLH